MNKSFQDVKAVLLDFGGTLDADGLTWRQQFFPIYRRLGYRWSKKEFDPLFYYADDTLTERSLKSVSYDKTIRLQVSLLLKKAGRFSPRSVEKVSRAYLRASRAHLRRNIPLLKRLKKKYRLGIVSNFYGNLPVILKSEGYGRLIGAMADSNRVGSIKPNPDIFLHVLRKLKVSPEESVFVGDSRKRDMRGAKELGMRHIWVANPKARKLPVCCPGDIVIRSVLELEDILL
ncbi:MAG: hypothetical protein A3A86_05920 [Elusimicrobia bacterium RIFCSPLOWO2_01_FULL_60_11]|nr:MAG: hypothetical protein A3A86_05920 [Elusimicrobia bacterium RIFCSPLOWO2_01_FULL_60_11]